MEYESPNISIKACECPITKLMDIIAAKWTVEILRETAIGPVRTRKFLRVIPGLSMKSLQSRLKELEKHGLIERYEYDVLPRRVEHLITERGKRVFEIYMQVKKLSEEMFNISCICPIEVDNTDSSAQFSCPHRPVGRD